VVCMGDSKNKDTLIYESHTLAAKMIGAFGVVSTDLSPSGHILVNGEFWSRQHGRDRDKNIPTGTRVEVVSVDGIHLKVRPVRTETRANNVSSKH